MFDDQHTRDNVHVRRAKVSDAYVPAPGPSEPGRSQCLDQGARVTQDVRPASSANDPGATTATHEPEQIGTFHGFRYRNYQLFWAGHLLTAAAMWTQQTVLGWVVYDRTGSGSILGAMNLMRMLSLILFSPAAGVASDRMSRNRIVGVTSLTMGVLTFVVAVDLWLGTLQIWHLFVFTFLVGSAQVFNNPARQTLVFDLVPRHVIPNAVALSWLAFSLARSVGPAVGGALIVVFGPANNFALQALAYFLVLVTVWLIRTPPVVRTAERRPMLASMSEGYGFVLRDPLARPALILSMVSPLLIIPLHASLLPIFAKQNFHTDASGLGILVASIGFGGLFGGLLTASLNRVDRRGLLQIVALLVFSLSETIFSILAAVTGSLWIAVPFLVVAGAAESVYTTTNTTVLQLLAPEHLRGSMASVLQLSFLLMPLGGFLAGASADVFGAPAVGATITFAAFSVGAFMLVFSPQLRGLRLSALTVRP
jgi:MFS family permease